MVQSEASPGARETGDGFRRAMDKAGRLLAARPRTEAELRRRLGAAGHPEPDVDRAIERLKELGVVDDDAFARQWIAERSTRGDRGEAMLVHELTSKGVDRSVAEELVDAAGLDEETRARALAARSVRKVARLPLPTQASRLQGLLLRRGFSQEVTEAAVRAVLPPDGWD